MKDKERHYIMTRRYIQQEDIDIYIPTIRAPKHIKQILTDLKGEIYRNIVIVGDSIPLTSIGRLSRQKISKETVALSNKFGRINLTDICTAFHLKTM